MTAQGRGPSQQVTRPGLRRVAGRAWWLWPVLLTVVGALAVLGAVGTALGGTVALPGAVTTDRTGGGTGGGTAATTPLADPGPAGRQIVVTPHRRVIERGDDRSGDSGSRDRGAADAGEGDG